MFENLDFNFKESSLWTDSFKNLGAIVFLLSLNPLVGPVASGVSVAPRPGLLRARSCSHGSLCPRSSRPVPPGPLRRCALLLQCSFPGRGGVLAPQRGLSRPLCVTRIPASRSVWGWCPPPPLTGPPSVCFSLLCLSCLVISVCVCL